MRLTSCLQRLAKKMSPPLRKSSSSLSLDDPSLRLVFFDTETTSLIKPDILQLAAVDFTGTKKFQSLIMPRMKCMPGSVKIHGYRKRDDGKMYFRGNKSNS